MATLTSPPHSSAGSPEGSLSKDNLESQKGDVSLGIIESQPEYPLNVDVIGDPDAGLSAEERRKIVCCHGLLPHLFIFLSGKYQAATNSQILSTGEKVGVETGFPVDPVALLALPHQVCDDINAA
jgi:hypothetical protein